jgi:hypothetical protein
LLICALMKRKIELSKDSSPENQKSRIFLQCEDKRAELDFTPPIPPKQLRKLISEKFHQNPENFLSLLSQKGEVIDLAQLATNPQLLLKDGTELTAIFSESEVQKEMESRNAGLHTHEIRDTLTDSDQSDNNQNPSRRIRNICAKCLQEYSDANETHYYHPGKLRDAETTTITVNIKRVYQLSQHSPSQDHREENPLIEDEYSFNKTKTRWSCCNATRKALGCTKCEQHEVSCDRYCDDEQWESSVVKGEFTRWRRQTALSADRQQSL